MTPAQVQSARSTAMPMPKAKIVMTVRSMGHLLSATIRKGNLRSPAPRRAFWLTPGGAA